MRSSYLSRRRREKPSSSLIGKVGFRHLELLAALGEHRVVHRAAEALHMSQPNATYMLNILERFAGFPLFERHRWGIRPTDRGAEVLALAQRALKKPSSSLIGQIGFRHLELLVALGEHRVVHRAAEALHIAQSTASIMLHVLEGLAGFPLFERHHRRGIRPTDRGAEVLAMAQRALADLRRFADDLKRLRNSAK